MEKRKHGKPAARRRKNSSAAGATAQQRQMPRPGRGEPQYDQRMNFKLTAQGVEQLKRQARKANHGDNVSGYLRGLLTRDRQRLGMRTHAY